MKNVIIGTAGHIDHGKTTLVKAITGRETDRLKEEQERGISIELGFTYFDLPSGKRAGIVDMPGHEKFINHMLAGVTGIDVVVLVVAADEGMMPQTKEHLHILDLLGLKKGVIAVTKTSLVDEEWLELVKEDIKEDIKGTFLESSKLIAVDSISKDGIDELVLEIDKLTDEVEEKDPLETPRLPVDRVFTIAGFGTVVTGTLISGRFKLEDEVQIFPRDKIGRIRNIQVHGEDSEEGLGGQRVAINISGVKKSDINRGDVISRPDALESTMMLDVKLNLMKDSKRIIENRTRVRVYIGASEVLARLAILDKEKITPGDTCYAQLRLEEAVVAKPKDKFIIRFYSPMETIGGGEVIESNPEKRKRFDDKTIEELKLKEKGETKEVVEKIILDKSKTAPSIKEISVMTVMSEDKVIEDVEKLMEEERVYMFKLAKDKHVVHRRYFDQIASKLESDLAEFHKKNSLKLGMSKEEIRSRYLKDIKPRLGDQFINKMAEVRDVKVTNQNISLKDFEVKLNSEQEEIKEDIDKKYLEIKLETLKLDNLLKTLNYDKKEVEQVFKLMIEKGILIRVKDDLVYHTDIIEECKAKLIEYLKANQTIQIADFRDLIGASRKVALGILEYFDDQKVTKRREDNRMLYK